MAGAKASDLLQSQNMNAEPPGVKLHSVTSGKIYHRSNGIVNVNCTTKGKCHQNVTLKLKTGKLSYVKVNAYAKTALARATDGGACKPRNLENVGLVSVFYPKKPRSSPPNESGELHFRLIRLMTCSQVGRLLIRYRRGG